MLIEQPDEQETQWILFQVGIFDIEAKNFNISKIKLNTSVTPRQMFVNVTVKEDLASIIAKSIVDPKIIPNRSYTTGEPIAHTFLGHVYNVFNEFGVVFNKNMSALICDYKKVEYSRLGSFQDANPLTQILFNMKEGKLFNDITVEHKAVIYGLLHNHEKITLKQWVENERNKY
jgi:hypothetical protein